MPQQAAQSTDAAVSVSNNKLARALLLIFEHEGNCKDTSGGPRWMGSVSVEHVLPRKLDNPKADWLRDPPEWNVQNQKQWLHRLGNLALLNGSDNSSLGNVSFSQKVAKMQKLGHASSWTIEDLLKHHKHGVWNKEAIQSRHTRLLEMLRTRWDTEKIAAGLSNHGMLSTTHMGQIIVHMSHHSHNMLPGIQPANSVSCIQQDNELQIVLLLANLPSYQQSLIKHALFLTYVAMLPQALQDHQGARASRARKMLVKR